MNVSQVIVWTAVVLFALIPPSADAATRRVCASGCGYANLQAAIDAAVPGDTILLRAGETFIGNFLLRKKSGTGTILIRSDAADTSLPAPGTRLVPSTQGGPTPLSALARLRGPGGQYRTTPVIRTEAGAHDYRLQFLDIDGVAQEGWQTLIQLGNNVAQTSTSLAPYRLVFDRVYIHGHPKLGQKRCVALDSASTDILNSYLTDCNAFATDSQAIAGFNGPGPFVIENNHIEAATENILFGGSDPKTLDLVPSDITIRRNHITKKTAWRNPILTRPASPRVSLSATKGSLAAGTHYFKVEAAMNSGGAWAFSLPSSEVSISVASGAAVTVTWSAVSGATRYRVYRGTSAGGESRWLETTTAATSLVYTGANERSAAPHTKATLWNVKNLIELKNARRVLIEGNVIEYVWQAAQNGYAIVLTPRNQDNTAPWTAVQDITLRYNTVRHANSGINILGYDYSSSGSQRTKNITVRHNVFDDLGPNWGGAGIWVLITQSPSAITLDHNTVFHSGYIVLVDNGASSGFVCTNNMAPHNAFGIFGVSSSPGTATLSAYFPSAVFRRNVIGGAKASQYPADNFYPTTTDFFAQFPNRSSGDYRLASASPYLAAATDGTATGADIRTLLATQAGTTTANIAPTASTGGPYTATAGQNLSVNGSGSKDGDGTIASYRWSWGDGTSDTSGVTAAHAYQKTGTFTLTLTVTDNAGATGKASTTVTVGTVSSSTAGDIVLTAASVSVVKGYWTRVSSSGSPGGQALYASEHGWWSGTPLASPAHYFEATFQPQKNVAYRLWLRMSAPSAGSDSVYVQFTGAVDSQGQPLWRIGTTSALPVNLENCQGCGVSGWGWQDGAFWLATPPPVRFPSSGPQTIRVQIREDGVRVDQMVLSPVAYFTSAPGAPTNDGTVLAATPLTPSAATIVLRSRDAVAGGGNWALENDASAAGGVRLGSSDRGWWTATPFASPKDYVDFTFTAVAGVKYRTWFRMSATGNSKANDSVFAQYAGASGGVNAIGTTQGLIVNRERCEGCGMSGWGWLDAAWWTGLTGEVTFATTGVHTLRLQTREDGVRVDQIVISPSTYLTTRPGAVDNDTTIIQP